MPLAIYKNNVLFILVWFTNVGWGCGSTNSRVIAYIYIVFINYNNAVHIEIQCNNCIHNPDGIQCLIHCVLGSVR